MNHYPVYDGWVAREEYERLQRERDELLAACEAMSEVADVTRADKVMNWGAFWRAANQIDVVIAKMSERNEKT